MKQGPRVTQLIQVCYDIGDPETKKREVTALVRASGELKCNDLLVITDDYEAQENKIRFIPLWKWLLTETAVKAG